MKKSSLIRVGMILIMVMMLSAGCSGLIYAVLRSLSFSVDAVMAGGIFLVFIGIWGLCFFRTNADKRCRRFRAA
ncbi:hypothetical protein [Eubacterium oxidoreducens]|uniref:Uncharacterized protein n=1 Tax=Eubacterium oxidoreducens TaxID=1732 RepID=A0A1G6AGZ6_EUBOX|nr:hypothetical protein [Eubacterium oxidoreducens]SDB07697.1 hypothetical protein SAMN02910417_00581 [Eubacterium oxidoreducens]